MTSNIGIDSQEIAWRKSFTGFDRSDKETLSEMSDTFERISEDLVDEFYDHLSDYPKAREILGRSSKTVEMLKRSQRQYLTDLGRGEYDRTYFDRRARIGKIHDILDLGPKVYMGAYSVYYEGIIRAIAEDVKQELLLTDGGMAAEGSAGDRPEMSETPETPESSETPTASATEAVDEAATGVTDDASNSSRTSTRSTKWSRSSTKASPRPRQPWRDRQHGRPTHRTV